MPFQLSDVHSLKQFGVGVCEYIYSSVVCVHAVLVIPKQMWTKCESMTDSLSNLSSIECV